MNNFSVKNLIDTERSTHVLFLAVHTMRRLIAGSALLMLILANFCSAQTVSTLANFRGSNATEYPLGMPTQGRDGNLYGTAYGTTYGSIFRVTTGGTITQLYAFDGSNGINPFTGLTLANDGNFYGTTAFGNSAASAGVLFKVSPTGFFTDLYEFTPDSLSEFPEAAPIQASDNNFYGVAYLSVYKYVSSTQSFSTLNSFTGANDVDGFTGALLQSSNGNLYGTGNTGGTSNCGGAFELARTGMLIANFSFNCQSPGTAGGPLVQANDGNYYGQTQLGGAFNLGAVFKMTPAGKVTNLHDFAGAANDGIGSILGLRQGTDGYLYGVTQQGGVHGTGTLFRISTSGAYEMLYSFPASSQQPSALVQHTNGKFYGFAAVGGPAGYGTFFSLDMGLGPFITFVRAFGNVGGPVQILGQGLTGTSAVTFNGVPASTFSVVSDTYMTAVVPSGATTGKVVVTTPSGPLTSNVNFRITP